MASADVCDLVIITFQREKKIEEDTTRKCVI